MTRFTRPLLPLLSRQLLLAAVVALPLAASAAAAHTDFDTVGERAHALAAQAYAPTPSNTPNVLRQLSYDQMRDIRFKPERAAWRTEQLPFELMFFHLGKYQTEPVRLHEITANGDLPFKFDPSDFTYGANNLKPQSWGDIGHAGFRVHYPLNNPAYKDELVVFQGASYFRALSTGLHYGLSARGLAVDTAGGGAEEFPRFTDFWMERPVAGATTLTVFALLDSPRVTGAYKFEIKPGSTTTMAVQARLYLRDTGNPIRTLGIAPLTSMFTFGENQPSRDDFRPEVHDSDGLMVASGEGEWLWRPLQNPTRPLVTSFTTRSPKGFGLMQRDRRFSSYEDSEASYERRPSAWVTPLGDWGAGRVELVQLPTPDETHDNIVAYWVPATLPPAGQPMDISWRVDWQGDAQQHPPAAWVAQTRIGRSFATLGKNEQQIIVDFNGPTLPKEAEVRAVASADGNARIAEQTVYRVEATGAWRLALRVKTLNPAKPVELRAYLTSGPDTVSETWTYVLPPL
ncbi:glucan biosynthesis protein G [Rhodoferax sp.]|uniref:glucan biosynthesis protein G n=1 Tax=Rhodoferax sp. TaxID=50421 RepID=UPI00374D82CC